MKRFEGKVALVTGGNSGIGLATARAFAREGASVVITGRDEASLKSAERELGGGAMALRADVSRLPEIDAAMARIRERFDRIDALFVNAGIGRFVPFDQVTEAFYDETMAVNLKGAYFTVQKALPLLRPGAGVVLNASISGRMGQPGASVYAATKAAVANLAKTLSTDLVGRGIRVNAVSPGPVETAIFERMGLSDEQLKQLREWIQSQVPLKRFGTGDEIAGAVLYLCSGDSSFVVGAEIVIDGGLTLQGVGGN
jgi:NAD(P)-dependent dehydrogenase (short-subunit alcohol dehydrogenase family)